MILPQSDFPQGDRPGRDSYAKYPREDVSNNQKTGRSILQPVHDRSAMIIVTQFNSNDTLGRYESTDRKWTRHVAPTA